MPMRADDRHITVAVDAGKEPGAFGDDGTPAIAPSKA